MSAPRGLEEGLGREEVDAERVADLQAELLGGEEAGGRLVGPRTGGRAGRRASRSVSNVEPSAFAGRGDGEQVARPDEAAVRE